MMKYIAAALICAALCAWGLYAASALKKRTACLNSLRVMLESCISLIERKGCDALQLLRELAECPQPVCFSFFSIAYSLMTSGASFADAFFMSSARTGELDMLDGEDKKLLSEYIYTFSCLPRDTLLTQSRNYAEIFGQRAAQAAQSYVKNGRLYVAAGFLSAALVVVLVI